MQIKEAKQHIEIFEMALRSKQCLGEQELEEYKLCQSIDTVLNELDKKDNYIETMHKEFDRLEGIEDNTSMLLKELVETKEHNRQLGLELEKKDIDSLQSQNIEKQKIIDKVKRLANNVLYFDDSSDYCCALWDILRTVNPDLGEYPILNYIEEEK